MTISGIKPNFQNLRQEIWIFLIVCVISHKRRDTISEMSRLNKPHEFHFLCHPTLISTGIPPIEGQAVIFGGYRFMSIAIATCNIIGNSVAPVVVAKWSGTFDAAPSRDSGRRGLIHGGRR